MFQLPAFIFSLVLISIYAVLFHLCRGKGLRDLLFFWLAAAVGFAAGQVVGQLLNLIQWTVGQVHVVEATLVALFFLVVARWLTRRTEET